MSINVRHDPEKGFIIITVKGKVSHEEYKKAMNEIIQSEKYPSDINALWDVREQNFEDVDSDTMKHIVDISKDYPQRGSSKVAFITESNLAFGMLRMYEMLSSTERLDVSQNVKVFRDYFEGEEWLLEEETI